MKKKLFEYLLAFIILLPLLFINIRNSHDWGDDFAMYIKEAKNITEGKPFYQSKFEFHNYNLSYAPPFYSYGFPLLLSPVIKIWGIDYKMLDRYMSAWLIAWGLLTFYYLRRYFSLCTCLSFTAIFFLNPFFFDFKTYVISDIPFSFFFLLSLLLYFQRTGKPLYYQIVTGLVIAFTIGIRGIGIVLLLLPAFDLIITFTKYFSKTISIQGLKEAARNSVLPLMSALIFILLFDKVLFKTPSNLNTHFLQLFKSANYYVLILQNLDIYTYHFTVFFRHNIGKYNFATQYAVAFTLTFLVIGFFISIFYLKKDVLLAIAYSIIILLFPFATQGFRYMLPLLPIFIYCVIKGAAAIRLPGNYYRNFLALLFVVFILLQYHKEVEAMYADQNNTVQPGPNTGYNLAAINYIKTTVPDTALVACLMPRALTLLANSRTCIIPAGADITDINRQLMAVQPAYLLSIKDMGQRIEELAAFRKDSLIWQNNACRLFICNKH